MKARYYGYCSIAPGSTITAIRWFVSPAGHKVLLEFIDERKVRWIGPEYPRDLATAEPLEIQSHKIRLEVLDTTIDAIQGWTSFVVEEKA